jgi:uncharacterized protein (TIGR02147 family)
VDSNSHTMSVFEFTNFRDYLNHRLSKPIAESASTKSALVSRIHSKKKNSSLEEISKSLGYKSPSLLSMVVNGKRLPSEELLDALMDHWNLSRTEREYFRLLAQLEKYKARGKDTSAIVKKLRKFSTAKDIHYLNEHEFSTIKEWHVFVIKQLVASPSFREDPKWISQVLRKKITPGQAKEALATLELHGFIKRDPLTNKLQATAFTETTNEIPSVAIRQHHQGMLERAIEAIEEQSIENRQFTALTFKMDQERLPEIKAEINEFVEKLYAKYDNAAADSVYQLNTNLFEHTKFQMNEPKGGKSNATH